MYYQHILTVARRGLTKPRVYDSILNDSEMITMTPRDFCNWLQGLFELGDYKTLSEQQVTIIRNHLNMVSYHETDKSLDKYEQLDMFQDLL